MGTMWTREQIEYGTALLNDPRRLRWSEIAAAMTTRFGREFSFDAVRVKLARYRQGEAPVRKTADEVMGGPRVILPPPLQTPPAAEKFDTEEAPTEPHQRLADPVERAERRDETARLRSEHEDLVRRLRELQARQRFVDEVGDAHEPPRVWAREPTSGVREMTAVVLGSDWHVEEPVDPASIAYRNEYNLQIAERRIRRFFQAIIWEVEHHRASGRIALRDMVLWFGGDLYSGYIHDELVEANELSPVEAVRWLQPLLRDGILTLLEVLQLERLVIPCSHGNHGRTTKKPHVSTGYANSFDWLLYHWLADAFRGDPRVEFEVTASAHQYVQVYGQTLHFHHGDDLKYQGGVGGLGIPLLKRVPVWDRIRPAALHCLGHWHTLRDYGRAIVNGSLIGYNAYSQRIGVEPEDPAQTLFFFDSKRGKSMLTPLWVDEALSEAA